VFFVAAAGAKICASICSIMDHPFPVACQLSAKFTVAYALSPRKCDVRERQKKCLMMGFTHFMLDVNCLQDAQ
jgi:hypothetical protein